MIQPRHVTCVLGMWKDLDGVAAIASQFGGELDREYCRLEPDDRMESAFAVSADRVDPSLKKQDLRAIETHSAVAYILSPRIGENEGQAISARMLAMIDALLADGGAIAVKCESAGIAHGSARWRELAARARSDELLERATALRLAYVRRPLGDEDIYYSCGMHLLGERDIEVPVTDDVMTEVGWMDLLATYLLAEKPARGVKAGEGFRQEAGGERRILRSYRCKRYDTDDFFFNPYGYWRLEPS